MEKEIIDICKSSLSMREAAKKLDLPFMTFKRTAMRLGVYKPNQGRKGISRIEIEDIFSGKIKIRSVHLKHKLYIEGFKKRECEVCGISEWNGKPLILELDHKNGDHDDNRLVNLRIICPNCHSQTPSYKRKKTAR